MAKKKRKQPFVVSRTTGIIIISFFAAAAVATVIKSNDPAEQARIELNTMRDACRDALLKKIPEPGSARLDEHRSWTAQRQQDGTVLVQPSGQVKNGSGAYVAATWNCLAKSDSFNYITVVSLEKSGP